MYEIGLSSCGKEINEALMEKYQKAGISAIEISPGMEGFQTLDGAMVRKASQAHNVKLWSAHLPFGPFSLIDISSLDEKVRESSIDYLSGIIRQAADMGIDKYVIHPSAEPIFEEERSARMEAAKDSLARLSKVAVACGGCLAVENLPRTCLGNCAADMVELLSASGDLRVCFDTNHLLYEDFEVFLKAVGDKIVTLHVSDYDFVNERHWLPGEGKMDWKRLLAGLEAVGYQGAWLYEINFSAPSSIYRPRALNCEDFARNAGELFAGKEPTVISKPVENLGFWGSNEGENNRWNIGICTDFRDQERLQKLKDMGFDFFEFGFSSIGLATEEEVDKAVAFVEKLGVPVASMNGLLPAELKVTGPEADHDKVAAFVEKTLKRAVRFGTGNFVLGSGGARRVPEGFSHEEATKQLEDLFINKLIPLFVKYDCVLSIEELRKEECNIYNSCKEVMASLEKINHPNLRLLVDYYHAVLGGDTIKELASYKGYISHVHIASPKNARHVPFAGDREDYAMFFEALKAAEYQKKNISLEGGFGEDYEASAKEALRYLRMY